MNESELFLHGQNDDDSAHAQFADWVEAFEASRLDFDTDEQYIHA